MYTPPELCMHISVPLHLSHYSTQQGFLYDPWQCLILGVSAGVPFPPLLSQIRCLCKATHPWPIFLHFNFGCVPSSWACGLEDGSQWLFHHSVSFLAFVLSTLCTANNTFFNVSTSQLRSSLSHWGKFLSLNIYRHLWVFHVRNKMLSHCAKFQVGYDL